MYNILTSHDANGIHKGVKTNGSEQYSKDFCSIHNERNIKKRQPSMKTVYKYAKLHDDGSDSFIPKPSKANLKKVPRGIKTRRVSPLEDPVVYPIGYGFDRKPDSSRYNYYNCLSPYSKRIIVTIPEVDCESEHSITNEASRMSVNIPIETRSPICRSGYVQASHNNSKQNINIQPAKNKQEVIGKQTVLTCKSKNNRITSVARLSKPPNHLVSKQNIYAKTNVDDKNVVKTENKIRTSYENGRPGSPVRRALKKTVPEKNDRVIAALLTGNLPKNNNNDLGTDCIKLDDIEKEFDKISARTRIMQKKLSSKRHASFGKNCTPVRDGRMVQKPDRKQVNLPKKNICPSQTQSKVNSFLVRKSIQNTSIQNSKREPCVEQQIASPSKSRTLYSKEISKRNNVVTVITEQPNQQFCEVIMKPPPRPRSPRKIENKLKLREERNLKNESKNAQDTVVNKLKDNYAHQVSDRGSNKLAVKSEMALKLDLNSNSLSLTLNTPKKFNSNCKSIDTNNIQRAISSPEAANHSKLPVPTSSNVLEKLCYINKDECTEKPKHSVARDNQEWKQDDEISLISCKSLPHLKVPDMTILARQKHSHLNNVHNKSEYILDKSESVFISQTYVSFTQEKQINIKVLDAKQPTDEQSSGVIGPMGPYPFSVMSVIQREMRTSHSKSRCNTENESVINQESFYNSRIQNICNAGNLNVDLDAYSKALIKPSDIIKEMRKSANDFLDVNALSTQFTRELNFLDSFIESIQYLKNSQNNNALLAEIKNKHSLFTHSVPALQQAIDCEPKFSKSCDLKNMTMAETDFDITKSICLLNLLIRDEHRRAKKLLFVLKMREDALKDFTKSQILWLQSKKKMLDTDVSILKKKQRGALLKLHQECGEMDRMRKILMTISERRQAALMQTKKNIELKLHAGCEVESLWKSRKKIKNNSQRSRNLSPIKCFEMSGNSYLADDSTDKEMLNYEKMSVADKSFSNVFKESPKFQEDPLLREPKPEKSVQTGNSIIEIVQRNNALPPCKDHTVVDGRYLNILLHNLALPQMFSSGKEYEVNTDALRGVLNSVNMVQNSSARVIKVRGNEPVVIVNEKNTSNSTSPSTARSLVEEFDQLFESYSYDKIESPENSEQKSDHPVVLTTDVDVLDVNEELAEKDEIPHSPSVTDANLPLARPSELVSSVNPAIQNDVEEYFKETEISNILPTEDKVETEVNTVESEFPKSDESLELKVYNLTLPPCSSQNTQVSPRESGPAIVETHMQHLCQPLSSISAELRRKELAIELEIKALQQQTQLGYCIREIPNKPPPPYTPPTQDASEVTPPQMSPMTNSVQADFEYDPDKLTHRINEICDQLFDQMDIGPLSPPNDTTFDVYLYDLCKEKIAKLSRYSSCEPWAACNVVPQKPPPTKEEFKVRIINEIFEMMNSNIDADSCGYGQIHYYQHKRPVNHIDDILLSDWRKCENEWTSLENDEVEVKNQVVRSVVASLINESLTDYVDIFTQQ